MRMRIASFMCVAMLCVLPAETPFASTAAAFQEETSSLPRETLRDRLRERYEIVALQDGIGLIPKRSRRDVRIIEVTGGRIAVNGEVVTGGELRERIGDDVELVLRLSYVPDAERRRLFGLDRDTSSGTEQDRTDRAEPSPPAPPAPPAAPEDPEAGRRERLRTRRSGGTVRILRGITVERDERITGDVVVVGNSARIDGEVTGEVVVVAGSLHLGDEAVVNDVTVVGGGIHRAPGARVRGELNDIAIGVPPVNWHGVSFPFWWAGPGLLFMQVWGLFMTLLRLGLLILLGWIVVAAAPGPIDRIARRAAEDPVKAGLVGLLAEVMFFPVLVMSVIILAISIIGIPLLILVPFALLAALIVMLIGFTAVAQVVGGWGYRRMGRQIESPYASIAVGIIIILSITLLAKAVGLAGGIMSMFAMLLAIVGFMIEFIAWTTGIGAAILVRFGRRLAPMAPTAVVTPTTPPPAQA